MTAIYIVAAWVIVQVASEALPALDLPDRAIRYVWMAVIAALPVVLVFSWRFDITTSGLRRTPPSGTGAEDGLPLGSGDYSLLAFLTLALMLTLAAATWRMVELRTATTLDPTTREIQPNSLAVLPLEDLSRDPDGKFFAAGIHDALITDLSRISGLMVTSRTSTLRVDEALTVPEISRRLGVAKLVEGSVTVDDDRVRIIIQLIDARSDLHLWADTFERDLADAIGLQNELARSIAEALEVKLTAEQADDLGAGERVDPRWYRTYLKGMYQFRQELGPADRHGVEILEQVARDNPESALAHAGVAYAYAHIAHSPFPGDAYPLAKAAADRALALNPRLAEAHLAIGMYRYYYEWDFDGAIRALERAIEISPSLAEAYYHLAWVYELYGPEMDAEALSAGEKTRELDPLSPFMNAWLADQYREACRYDEALKLGRETVRLDPAFPIGWWTIGFTYSDLGQFDEAIDAHRRLADVPEWAWVAGLSYAAAGLDEKAREIARQYEESPGTELPLGLIYASLGDREAALHWVAAAERARVPWYPAMLGWLPGIDRVADDPELRRRAEALGLPDPVDVSCGQ